MKMRTWWHGLRDSRRRRRALRVAHREQQTDERGRDELQRAREGIKNPYGAGF